MKTMNGMTYGLFATLIIGVIIRQFGYLLDWEILYDTVYQRLASLMGVGIGLGIGLSLGMDGLKLVVAAIIGGISTSFRYSFDQGLELIMNNEPLTVYITVILALLALNYILKKRTPYDILLVPLLGITLAVVITLLVSAPTRLVVLGIQDFIVQATVYAPFFMSITIAVVMGMLLTSPISSAAIAITLDLSGAAAGAAVVGTTAQMIGFAVQSRRDNGIGMMLSIAFGTSMLQFKNILKKPIIWLPTIIASAVLAPFFVLVLGTTTTSAGAGMGSSGLVGPLQTLADMHYATEAWLSVGLMVILPVILVYALDLIFTRRGWIVRNDLAIHSDIS
ncbi:MAG: PTS sugar transporter subunit IIC [Acholeplasmataceae bacterium]